MPERDPDAVLRLVERMTGALENLGLPRMAARVFCALLVTDSARLTAGELSAMLGVSPAAISGAVRYLVQVGLITREREPRSRREHYVLGDDVWYEAVLRRDRPLREWMETAREGVELLGAGTPAGARMRETLAFYEFVIEEMPALLERWYRHKAALRAAGTLT